MLGKNIGNFGIQNVIQISFFNGKVYDLIIYPNKRLRRLNFVVKQAGSARPTFLVVLNAATTIFYVLLKYLKAKKNSK